MSILINMEMPECCDKCFALDDHGDYPRCLITHEQRGYNFRVREKRMDKCPLIEVPPHGRLIDADATVQVFDNSYGGNTIKTTISKFILAHIVGEIPPTVIPADKDVET